jgi:hypothetical protein
VRRHDPAVDDSMQAAERRDLQLPGERQRTDPKHLVIARAVDVGQHEHEFMAQLRASHKRPLSPIMAAVRAIEPDGPPRMKTHPWVKASEHAFKIAPVDGIRPAHDRITRRRGRGSGHAKPAARTVKIDHPGAARIAREGRHTEGISPLLAIAPLVVAPPDARATPLPEPAAAARTAAGIAPNTEESGCRDPGQWNRTPSSHAPSRKTRTSDESGSPPTRRGMRTT